jgi:tripartite-type tricarboxylate transporter receptor subunit TctC
MPDSREIGLKTMHRLRTFAALGVFAFAALGFDAAAQPYPSKPIKLVVANPPGGLTDTVSRILAPRLQEALGQPVVIDNKPGANGAVAAAALAALPHDGYSFLIADGSMLTVNPLMTRDLAYDPKKDFTPVSLIARAPLFLAVRPDMNVNTLDELVAKAKAGPLSYGSSGVGSTHHLTMEAMAADLGIHLQHVPFRGSSASVPALLGGQVSMVFSAYPSLVAFDKAGKVKLIAMNAAQRSALAPDVPAIAEKIRGFDFAPIVILLASAGVPPEAVQRVSAEIAKIAKRQDVIDLMRPVGIDLVGGSPAQLTKALDEEAVRMVKAAKQANLKKE